MPSNDIVVTISSVGTGQIVALDWMRGGPTTVGIRAASTTTAAPSGGGVLQYTLDDITTAPSAAAIVWNGASSVWGSTVAGVVVTTSGTLDVPYTFLFTTPVAGLRFSCSAFSSTSLVMKILQG
jgi:hypothetical protein